MNNADLVVDIGSGSIGAAVVTKDKAGQIILDSVRRVQIGSGSDLSRASITERATEALKTLLAEYAKEARLNKVHLVLASPWYEARIRTILSQSSKKPVRVTRATVSRTVREYEKANPGERAAGRTPIESVVTQVYVNGYPTAIKKPVLGSNMRVNIFESEADTAFVEKIRELVKSTLPKAKIVLHSFPLVAFIIMRAMRDESGFVFADVGGEITDVFITDRDSLRYLGSFPIGTQTIARALSTKGDGTVSEDVISRLALFGRGELSMNEMTEFKTKFDTASAPWIQEFKKIQESVVVETPFPQTVFVAADSGELDWLPILFDPSHFEIPLRAISITPDFFSSSMSLGEGGVYDAFISLESNFTHREHDELIEYR